MLVERGPVGDRAEEAPDVDEVEGGWGVDPFAAHVVDFEAAVVGLHAGLDRAKVCADYFGVWELVGDVGGPDACAGSWGIGEYVVV